MEQKHSDEHYLEAELFDDGDAEMRCMTKKIISTRKEHRCAFGDALDTPHQIPLHSRVLKESGLVEGEWGSAHSCLSCIDRWFDHIQRNRIVAPLRTTANKGGGIMRIHSSFRDYYDNAAGYGIDTTLHYERYERKFYLDELKSKLPEALFQYAGYYHKSSTFKETGFVIEFCGRLYPCVKIAETMEKYPYSDRITYLYKPSELAAFGRQIDGWRLRNLKDFLSKSYSNDEIFIEVGAPLFVIQKSEGRRREFDLVANIQLRPFEFYRIVDSFTAFQEVAMYVSNQLVRREQVNDVPDRFKISQHGYDEWSFRKMPKR